MTQKSKNQVSRRKTKGLMLHVLLETQFFTYCVRINLLDLQGDFHSDAIFQALLLDFD
jgi:hypothetical protein